MIFRGIQTSIAKKPYFCDFSGGDPDPLSSPLDPRMSADPVSSLFAKVPFRGGLNLSVGSI